MHRILFLLLFSASLTAQPIEATLLYHWSNDAIPPTSWLNNRYNEVFGTYINGREIAILGSTAGVHFFDITDPANAAEIENAFVAGTAQGTSIVHRDYKTFGNYLYTVCDEGASTLQVIDMSGLPDSVELVYNSNSIVVRAHNVYVDSSRARLHVFGDMSNTYKILSLDNPEAPELIAAYPGTANFYIPYVHDGFVRNDTAYLNCGQDGFYAIDFTDILNPVLLGTMDGYQQEGYNHSGWMHPTLPVYYMADETHGRLLKVVDVDTFDDMEVVSLFGSGSTTPTHIAHNIMTRDNLVYVSYYYDGLQVFDVSDPYNPVRIAYYDTYPDLDDNSYQGAWGVYCGLPSGRVLLSDMNYGLFVFEKIETPSHTSQRNKPNLQLSAFPNPGTHSFALSGWESPGAVARWFDLAGIPLTAPFELNSNKIAIPEGFSNGLYILSLYSDKQSASIRIVVER